MSEVARLKADLQGKKFEKMEIETRAQVRLDSIKALLAGSSIRSLGEIDLHLVYDIAKDLRALKEKWTTIVSDIEKIQKELE